LQIWSPADRQDVLDKLSNIFIERQFEDFGSIFRPILLDIITRSRLKIEKQAFDFRTHQQYCIALSNCLQWPDVQR